MSQKYELSLAELSAESVRALPERSLMRRRHMGRGVSISQTNNNPQTVNVGGDNNGTITISSNNSNSVSF
jgi:hypothetical protein